MSNQDRIERLRYNVKTISNSTSLAAIGELSKIDELTKELESTIDRGRLISLLHQIKLCYFKLGRGRFDAMESLRKLIESNPFDPELELEVMSENKAKEEHILKPDGTPETYYPPLQLTNEDLQDDNPIEEDI